MNDTILEIKDLHVLFPVHKKVASGSRWREFED